MPQEQSSQFSEQSSGRVPSSPSYAAERIEQDKAKGSRQKSVQKLAMWAIAAAVVTISLKMTAWRITGSVGLLSDAVESIVNLVAAMGALIALKVAGRPDNTRYNFGYSKVEYFSAVAEGVMIIVAALVIIATAIGRLLNPIPLEAISIGLGVSIIATVVNGVMAIALLRGGRLYRSISLTADGKHLLTDVWTTIGVIIGVLLVFATGWLVLDPIIAIFVAANIIREGIKLVLRSGAALLDGAVAKEALAEIEGILDRYRSQGISFHALRTRESGSQRFMQIHVLVPDEWTVRQGHDLVESVEKDLRAVVPGLNITSHLEPQGDARSYEDIELFR